MRCRRLFLLVVPLAVVGSLPARAQERPNLLTYGIVGSDNKETRRASPMALLEHQEVQKLLLDIAAEPRDTNYVAAAMKGSGFTADDLEASELVRRDAGRYVLHFNLFTHADVKKTREVSEQFGRSLTVAFLARRPQIEKALAEYKLGDVDPKAVAYILLGCFALDWDGLTVTEEEKYRTRPPDRPGIGSYGVWAEERGELPLKGIYWGSHNESLGEITFTSFGDHFSLPRSAFPDLLWRLHRATGRMEAPELLRPLIADAAEDALARQAAQMMMALRDGAMTQEELAKAAGTDTRGAKYLLRLLAGLHYIAEKDGRYGARIPVLTGRDAAMTRQLAELGRQIMKSWLAAHYGEVRAALADLTPVRYGVPYAEVFTQIWHYIFGTVNRQLVEAGLFADPYAEGREYKGFIPVVWLSSLSPEAP